jgi:hypothetical protein
MERSSKRGKIPQQDWPSIMARYEAGETLANIARTYDCSPPAISYIVSRSRARGAAPTPNAPPPPEPQLVKSYPTEPSPRQSQRVEAPTNGPLANSSLQDPPRLETQGGPDRSDSNELGPSIPNNREERAHGSSPRPPNPALMSSRYGEANRTLHLAPPHVHGAQSDPGAQSPDAQSSGRDALGASTERAARPSTPGLQSFGSPAQQGANGAPLQLSSEPQISGDGGVFIDRALRERVEADIEAFLTAFDAALARDTPESRAGLREATDRLLRAGARTRIELERLEARVPLSPRNGGKQYEPAGRPR